MTLFDMKLFLFAVFFLALCTNPMLAQRLETLTLNHESVEIASRDFYISNVADERYGKEHLGWVRAGSSNRKVKAIFANSLRVTLEEYLRDALPRKENQTPVALVVKVFRVFEEKKDKEWYRYADVRVEFYYQSKRLFIAEEQIEISGTGSLPAHESNLRQALEGCLHQFAASGWKDEVDELEKPNVPEVVIDNKFENPDQAFLSRSSDAANEEPPKGPNQLSDDEIQKLLPKNRNYWVVGLFVGGLGIAGLEYETRFHDHLGLNLGISYSGYTAGIKFHFKPTMNGTFLNANMKDGGFGLLHVVGLDFGQRIGFSKKKKIGLVYQVGLGYVSRIDPDFRNYLYGSGEAPPLMLSTGVGISF